LTVLPGWIDAHVHITWSFGMNGKMRAEERRKRRRMRQPQMHG